MARATSELASIPFGALIGGPLSAAVEAQATSAKTTADFIKEVGFLPGGSDPFDLDAAADGNAGAIRNVTFTYKVTDVSGDEQNATLTVPILTIIPIPFLRIDEMTIDFTAKINDVHSYSSVNQRESEFNLSANVRFGWGPIRARINAGYSSKRKNVTENKSKYSAEYGLDVYLKAVQDDMPGGMARMLTILENTINEDYTPAAAV